jgi:RNA polymerase sigma-70 factor (ECF subfamily)
VQSGPLHVPPGPVSGRDTVLDVDAALRRLPGEQRAALVLVDMLGYPVADAAEVLGVSAGTVKSRCARGRARLAPLLMHLAGGPAPGATGEPDGAEAPGRANSPAQRNRPAVRRVSSTQGLGPGEDLHRGAVRNSRRRDYAGPGDQVGTPTEGGVT